MKMKIQIPSNRGSRSSRDCEVLIKTRRRLTILPLLGLVLLPVIAACAGSVTVTVSGASGPWDISLNPGYPYGYVNGGVSNSMSPPSVTSASSDLPWNAGDTLTISSLTPGQQTLLAGAGGSLWSDADGVRGMAPVGDGPSQYVQYPDSVNLEEVMGVFATHGIIVGAPFAIGDGPIRVAIPTGANQRLMGVSDGWYNDNGGSVQMSIVVSSRVGSSRDSRVLVPPHPNR